MRLERAKTTTGLAIGIVLAMMACPDARADFINDITQQSGTVYVLVSDQTNTGAAASVANNGVWSLKRIPPASGSVTDQDYRISKLPSFAVHTARGLGVDKFGRVFVSDSSATTHHNIAAEGASANVTSSVSGTPASDHVYQCGYVAQIMPDGTVTYPGAALWTKNAGTTESSYKWAQWPPRSVAMQTALIDGVPVTYPTEIAATPDTYDKQVFTPNATAEYLPPPMHVLPPTSYGTSHGTNPAASLYTYYSAHALYPFPTHGVSVPVSLYAPFINTNSTVYTGYFHGWEVRYWTGCTFDVTPFYEFMYCDSYAQTNLGCPGVLSPAGDAIYTALAYNATSELYNMCGDPCYTSAGNPNASGQTAEARANFSTFGQTASEQKMFVAMTVGGQYAVREFTLNGSSWQRDTIVAPGGAITSGWGDKVFLRPGVTYDTYRTVGNSALDGNFEYLYLSDKDSNHFSVSSNYYRQGGVIYELSNDGTAINWEERIEGTTPASQSGTVPNVPAGTAAIATDGQDNVYMLRLERGPGGPDDAGQATRTENAIEASIPQGTSNPIPSNYTVSPYFQSDSPSGSTAYDRNVMFNRTCGMNVYKTNRFNQGSPTPIVLDSGGNQTVVPVGVEQVVGKVKFTAYDNQGNPSAAVWFAPPDGTTVQNAISTVNNRFEVAAINVALPPPVDSANLVDVLWYGSTTPPVAPITPPTLKGDSHIQVADVTEDTVQYFGLENPPQFAGLVRTGISNTDHTTVMTLGQSNDGSTADEDLDGRAGRFSQSLIWGPDTSTYPTYLPQFCWSVENITFHDSTAGQANPDANRGWRASGQGYGSAPSAGSSPASWFDATRDASKKVYDPWVGIQFIEPGRYRVRLYARGYYWSISLGSPPSLDNPAYFYPSGFGGNDSTSLEYGEMTVNVKQKDITGSNYVDSLLPQATVSGQPPSNYLAINQGVKPAIFTPGRVQWYRGYNLESTTQQLAKSYGVGKWWYDASWPFNGGPPPPNASDRKSRNDGDGDWGTRGSYDNIGDNDMIPFASGDSAPAAMTKILAAQQTHDWYELKYEWTMKYFNPQLLSPPGINYGTALTAGSYAQQVLKDGNLAELLVLQANLASGAYASWWPSSTNFVAYNGTSRQYAINIPLLDPSHGGTNILSPASSKNGTPTGSAGAQPYVWNVPTDPSFVKLTCAVTYPKVQWDPVADVTGTVEEDTSNKILYYNVMNDPLPTPPPPWNPPSPPPAPVPPPPPAWQAQYERSGATSPNLVFSDPFTTGDDNDDYVEVKVRDTQGLNTATAGSGIPPLVSNLGAKLGSGTTGQRSDQDIAIKLADNNPYVHFSDWHTLGANPAWPAMTQAFYELGSTAVNGPDQWGVGPLSNAYWGFDLWDPGYTSGTAPLPDYERENTSNADPNAASRPINSTYYHDQTLDTKPAADGLSSMGSSTFTKGHNFTMTGNGDYVTPNPPYADLTQCQSKFDVADFAGGPGTACYRTAAYNFPHTEMYLPLFSTAHGPAGGEKGSGLGFLVSAQDRSSVVVAPASTPGHVPAVSGYIEVNDTLPPNLKVMLLNEKTQQAPVYFIVEGYYGKYDASGNVAGGLTDTARYYVVKRANDTRPDLNIAATPYYKDKIPEPTGVLFDFGGPNGGAASWDSSFTNGAFEVEQDVRLLVKAFASDNTADSSALTIALTQATPGSPVTPLEASPQHTEGQHSVSTYMRLLYPRPGMDDEIDATATGSGTSVTMHIHIHTVPNVAQFRNVGSGGQGQ